jgi:hypothetical protein
MNSARDDAALPAPGCPIRKSPVQSLLSGSPKLIAASHVLRHLLAPRHPPYALSSLTIHFVDHAIALSLIRIPVCNCQRPADENAVGLISSETSIRWSLSVTPRSHGESGADRSRTDGLRLARAALSQLSYSPLAPDCDEDRNRERFPSSGPR